MEKFRHELKYLISEGERRKIVSRMGPVFKKDPNAIDGIYMIRSLYFDDYLDSAFKQKEDGVLERKKYRIRIYNYSDSVIRLERKKKRGAYIYKESAPLSKEEFQRILDHDYGFLLDHPSSLCREFYVECISNMMRPKTIVDYEREPWILDAGTVRVTFDMNVRAALGSFDIFDEDLPCLSVLEQGKMVMEVKYTEFLPKIVQDLIPPDALEYTAVSKYVLCFEKTQYLRDQGYWVESDMKRESNRV